MKNKKRNRPGFLAALAISAGILGSVAIDKINNKLNETDVESKIEKNIVEESRRMENGAFVEYTAGWEGRRNRVYDPNPRDGRDEPTIGVGHFLDRGDSMETFERVIPEVNYEGIYSGNEELTDNQVDRLFSNDIQIYIDRTRNRIVNFDNFPEYLQTALVDATYRGDLGPRTRELINISDFRGAATEYLNHEGFRTAEDRRMNGIVRRMNSNQERILRYADELEER
jgi:hypothetical protein